jgi:type I restriction enzyme R subunit
VPDRFDDRPRAPAYYGAFLDQLGEDASDRSEDDLVAEAIWIDDTVNDAVRLHSINQESIEAAIRKAMLPRYFDFFGGLDEANSMIEGIIGIVRAGTTKGDR